jgi:hypothetical protein
VEGIPAERVIVSLIGGPGVILDAVRVDLKGPGPHAVELVGKEPNLVVRLKGISAADTEEGHVGIMSVGSTDLWHTWAQPDAEGEFRFRRPPVESFALIFYHREYGRQGQIFSTLNEGVQVVELEVGIPGRINIIATDRSGPIVGVSWDVRLAAVAASYHTGLTNSEGSTGELLLGEGTFTLSLSRSGYWHIEHDFEVSPPGGRMEFAIRRLGNLAVAVLDGAGNRVPGARLEFENLEYGERVSDWLAKGRLTSEAVQLVSDATGGANLVGLPHGQYRWSCSLPGGTTAGGVCTIPPGEWGQLEIRLEL